MAKIHLPKYMTVQQAGSNVLVRINTRHPSFLSLWFREAVRQSRALRLAIAVGRLKVSLPAWPVALPLILKHIWRLARGDKLEKAI